MLLAKNSAGSTLASSVAKASLGLPRASEKRVGLELSQRSECDESNARQSAQDGGRTDLLSAAFGNPRQVIEIASGRLVQEFELSLDGAVNGLFLHEHSVVFKKQVKQRGCQISAATHHCNEKPRVRVEALPAVDVKL